MNKFQFMGRLTRDPETRVLPNSSTNVTTFSLAVNRRFADANGERKTDFFNIQNRSWDDQNGQKRYATDFIVENAYFADSRRDQDMPAGEVPSSSMDGEFITVEDTDELPF